MNRTTQRKVSRALVATLGVTVAMGGVFWLGKTVGSASGRNEARAERGETTEAVVAAAAKNQGDVSPTTKPSAGAGAGGAASDLFASSLAQASVIQTPTAPVASPASPAREAPATGPAQVTTTPPILAAAATRP